MHSGDFNSTHSRITSDNRTERSMHNILSNLNEVVKVVKYAVEARTLDDVLQRIADGTRQIMGVRYAALGIPDGEGGLRFFKVSGMSEDHASMLKEPLGRGLLGAIMSERRIIRLADMKEHPMSSGFPTHHPYMKTFLGAPVQVGHQLFGMLYITDRTDGQPFDQADEWLIEMMAGYAALAIAGVELSEQQNQITLLEERDRIAMELHDGIIQSLYAIGMQLALLKNTGSLSSAHLNGPINALDQVIDDIRDYIMDLRTSQFEKRSVYDTLEDMVARLQPADGTVVKIEAPHQPPPISAVSFEAMCQIVNEAVSNAVRHAHASEIRLRAFEGDGCFMIRVADNGKGFNLEDPDIRQGMGLNNIWQRVRLHQGTIDIESESGQGTTLTVSFPA